MKELYNFLPDNSILENEPMKNHTTFRIGGNADVLVLPQSVEQLKAVIDFAKGKSIPYMVIGNGSDLLVSDNGIRGIVIKTTCLDEIKVDGECITAGVGALLSKTASVALANSLTGMEFAHGIPGTVGGGVFMNAGAYDGELKDIVAKTTYLDADGQIKTCTKHDFGYRSSVYSKNSDRVILNATFKLHVGNKETIEARMAELALSRRTKQPIEMPSAGSVFKRPQGFFVGKLVQDCNLRGFSIGGAQISDKHCGFIVNKGDATAKDVLDLIEYIRSQVRSKFGVEIETEIRYIGE
ncbi:MAG: UDP-N-acetylmuramate dehydrogenase [Eubacteriales bacterium]|nr:UDP-N-acetylmuramate dehydrogenase [Eubacteriales bacterium]